MKNGIRISGRETWLLVTALAIYFSGCGGSSGTVPISVSVSIVPSSVPLGGTAQAAGSVSNDRRNKGVTWALMQSGAPCSPGCGTISSQSSLSGTPINYTAPAAMPADSSLTIVASSVADPARSSSATIKLLPAPPADTVTLVPSTLSFGNTTVGQSKSLATILTNSGGAALSISNIGIGQSSFAEVNTCGATLAPNSSCTITVTFTPKSTGTQSADLLINDNAVGSPQDVHLTGKGKPNMNSAAIRSALTRSATVSAPSVSGSVRVGTRELGLVDLSREDPYTANGTPRELLVRFWYPAGVSGSCTLAEYAASKVWGRFSELVGVPLPSVTTNSCADAPVMDGAHPIVIFTPGYTGTMTDYTFLFEDLASRGYIVASVDHTFEATAVEFPDGRLVNSVLGSYLGGPFRGDMSAMTFAVSVRLRDLQFVLNELGEMNQGSGNAFAGKLDMSRIALAGHSMGGVTALLGLQQDPRFKAGVVIDGDFTNTMPSPTLTPVLILGMGRQPWAGEECSLWNELGGPRLAVNFLGADHMTPTDGVWIAKGAIPAGDMGMDKTVSALRRYVSAFLDANLRGTAWDAMLLGPSADFPAAMVTTQNQSLCGVEP